MKIFKIFFVCMLNWSTNKLFSDGLSCESKSSFEIPPDNCKFVTPVDDQQCTAKNLICQCQTNEEYSDCGNPCEPTCENPDSNTVCMTLLPLMCQPGCICLKGFYRNDENQCVPLNRCENRTKAEPYDGDGEQNESPLTIGAECPSEFNVKPGDSLSSIIPNIKIKAKTLLEKSKSVIHPQIITISLEPAIGLDLEQINLYTDAEAYVVSSCRPPTLKTCLLEGGLHDLSSGMAENEEYDINTADIQLKCSDGKPLPKGKVSLVINADPFHLNSAGCIVKTCDFVIATEVDGQLPIETLEEQNTCEVFPELTTNGLNGFIYKQTSDGNSELIKLDAISSVKPIYRRVDSFEDEVLIAKTKLLTEYFKKQVKLSNVCDKDSKLVDLGSDDENDGENVTDEEIISAIDDSVNNNQPESDQTRVKRQKLPEFDISSIIQNRPAESSVKTEISHALDPAIIAIQPEIRPAIQPPKQPEIQPAIQLPKQPEIEPAIQPPKQPEIRPGIQPPKQPEIEPAIQPPKHQTGGKWSWNMSVELHEKFINFSKFSMHIPACVKSQPEAMHDIFNNMGCPYKKGLHKLALQKFHHGMYIEKKQKQLRNSLRAISENTVGDRNRFWKNNKRNQESNNPSPSGTQIDPIKKKDLCVHRLVTKATNEHLFVQKNKIGPKRFAKQLQQQMMKVVKLKTVQKMLRNKGILDESDIRLNGMNLERFTYGTSPDRSLSMIPHSIKKTLAQIQYSQDYFKNVVQQLNFIQNKTLQNVMKQLESIQNNSFITSLLNGKNFSETNNDWKETLKEKLRQIIEQRHNNSTLENFNRFLQNASKIASGLNSSYQQDLGFEAFYQNQWDSPEYISAEQINKGSLFIKQIANRNQEELDWLQERIGEASSWNESVTEMDVKQWIQEETEFLNASDYTAADKENIVYFIETVANATDPELIWLNDTIMRLEDWKSKNGNRDGSHWAQCELKKLDPSYPAFGCEYNSEDLLNMNNIESIDIDVTVDEGIFPEPFDQEPYRQTDPIPSRGRILNKIKSWYKKVGKDGIQNFIYSNIRNSDEYCTETKVNRLRKLVVNQTASEAPAVNECPADSQLPQFFWKVHEGGIYQGYLSKKHGDFIWRKKAVCGCSQCQQQKSLRPKFARLMKNIQKFQNQGFSNPFPRKKLNHDGMLSGENQIDLSHAVDNMISNNPLVGESDNECDGETDLQKEMREKAFVILQDFTKQESTDDELKNKVTKLMEMIKNCELDEIVKEILRDRILRQQLQKQIKQLQPLVFEYRKSLMAESQSVLEDGEEDRNRRRSGRRE